MAILLGLMAGVLIVLQRKLRGWRGKTYTRQNALMSPEERSFFEVLERAVGGECRVFSKVRLADVVRVKQEGDGSARQSAFNRIQSKHVDFVACDPRDMSIRFVVELDGRSHERRDRRDRDEDVEEILSEAGVRLFRFAVKPGYSVEEMRSLMLEGKKEVH